MSLTPKSDNTKYTNTGFSLVKVVHWYGDESEAKFYSIPDNILELMRQYLITGVVADELHSGLQKALSNSIIWSHLVLSNLSTNQREALIGMLIVSTYKEITTDFEVNVPYN